jgi:hypothetical protein
MPRQLNLFGADSALPAGFRSRPELVPPPPRRYS